MDVGVEQAGAPPRGREGAGEVGRNGRLADAALGTRNGEDGADPRERNRLGGHRLRRGCSTLGRGRGCDRQPDAQFGRSEGGGDRTLEHGRHVGASAGKPQGDDRCTVLDADFRDHAQAHDVPGNPGIAHRGEKVSDLLRRRLVVVHGLGYLFSRV